jgi:GNAT superfamily N-acetyltransferase
MQVAQASHKDLPALRALTIDCVAAMRERGIEQWDEVYPGEAVIAGDLAAGTLHALWEQDEIIGCVTVDAHADPLWQGLAWSADGAPFAAVHRLMIHPARQGRGLSKLLMAHAESLARAEGRRSIRLDTFSANPVALALYEKLDYRPTGTAMMRKGEFVGFEKLLH